MKLFSIIRNIGFSISARHHSHILELQQTIRELTTQNNELATNEKSLRKELQFIYSIIIHRRGCRLGLFPLLQQDSMLVAVEHKINQVNFYLYIPNQQSNEIAHAYTNVQNDDLVIHEFYVAPTHSNPQIHSFLLHQIKMEAKALGLSAIYAYQPDTAKMV